MRAETVGSSLTMEMRRGTVVLLVLCCLEEPRYGYSLSDELSAMGVAVEGNTLYPLLRRLAGQGLLSDAWDVSGPKPRKYYRITELGREMREDLVARWQEMSGAVKAALAKAKQPENVRGREAEETAGERT